MKRQLWVFILPFLLITGCQSSRAQNEKPTFGIVIRPIVPSTLFTGNPPPQTENKLTLSYSYNPGFGFGGVMRKGLGRVFSLESGIYYTRRNYRVQIEEKDSFNGHADFSFINYEIPVMGLIYIRLSDKSFLNNAFGLSLDFFPNDLVKEEDPYYALIGLRKYWLLPALEAMTGYEYRTANAGFFYLGASYHRMLTPLGQATLVYKPESMLEQRVKTSLSGHYFALEFKYFFSNKRYSPPVY